MKFSVAAILVATASFASAANFRVDVGQDKDGKTAVRAHIRIMPRRELIDLRQLLFSPDQVKAKVGDQIEFHFHAKNHTVTQSSFAEPCTRQRNTVTNELGADSGFMPVAADAKEIPVWTIQIKQDNAPIWMFCNQGK
jgi:plastocyanin